jgi:uncharacterized protein YbbC (DUF1343 family)
MNGSSRVGTGLDVLIADRFASLRGRRVGVIANPTSVDVRFRHLVDLLHSAAGVTLVSVFGPEHGVHAEAQDLIGVAPDFDRRTGVPIHSLYGADEASLTPTPAQLEGLDALVFDVQDVGSRYYTFAATMKYAMTAAARAGIGFVVLDRPNPIGGTLIEGPTVEAGYESFVGTHSIPIRHGMTIGELARLFRSDLGLDLELEVVPCTGLNRGMTWDETGLPWILPSPNMPTPDTAAVYPGGCLIEGTNLSEGRGTTRPFELWGAPWLEPYELADAIDRATIATGTDAGVILRPCSFRPTFQKYAGWSCAGVQVHVVDTAAFHPVAYYTVAIAVARRLVSDRFAWRTEPYEFLTDPIAIDLLFGSSRERTLIEEDPPDCWARQLFEATWRSQETAFRERREPFLLYR